jgi:hypothetical protein
MRRDKNKLHFYPLKNFKLGRLTYNTSVKDSQRNLFSRLGKFQFSYFPCSVGKIAVSRGLAC